MKWIKNIPVFYSQVSFDLTKKLRIIWQKVLFSVFLAGCQQSVISMTKFKSYCFFKPLIVCFSLVYVFATIANVLNIPRYNPVNSCPRADSYFAEKNHTQHFHLNRNNSFRAIEKSTLENEQLKQRLLPVCLLLIFTAFSSFRILSKIIPPRFTIFYNLQHAYLTHCNFRI